MGLIPEFLTNNAGALAGGLLGFLGNSGSSKANETTATRDPWAPSQPYIMRNLQDQQELQDYYKKNPFNAQQQAGYNNVFADADHFRSSVAPGLMDFANKGMTGSYERQRGGTVGSGAGYGGLLQPGGMRSGGQGPFSVAPYVSATQASMASTGPMQDGSTPPTVTPSGGRFGQVDFTKNNPYTNGAIKPAEQKAYEAMTTGGLLSGGGVPSKTSGNGMAQRDFNPSWSGMGDVEKAQYYNDNPMMAQVTQLLQLGFSLTDIAKLQEQMAPGFVEKQRQIASGDAFGGGPGFGGVDFGRDTFAGLGPGDISQMGVDLGQFGDGGFGLGADGYGGGYRGDNGGAGYGNAPAGHPDNPGDRSGGYGSHSIGGG